MFKKLMIGSIIATLAFTQGGVTVGGFVQMDEQALLQLRQNQNFQQAEELARQEYKAERNGELGRIVTVSQQIVSGVNYRMIFETQDGQFEVTVYVQPWTNTRKVLDMKPVSMNS